ncbi:hypothetical protein [Nonomuraea recticatena]
MRGLIAIQIQPSTVPLPTQAGLAEVMREKPDVGGEPMHTETMAPIRSVGGAKASDVTSQR